MAWDTRWNYDKATEKQRSEKDTNFTNNRLHRRLYCVFFREQPCGHYRDYSGILATVDNQLESGVQYNIKFQVGQDKVTIGSITAMPWGYAAGGVLETE